MGPEKAEVGHAQTQALSLSWSQLGEQKMGKDNLGDKRKRTGWLREEKGLDETGGRSEEGVKGLFKEAFLFYETELG